MLQKFAVYSFSRHVCFPWQYWANPNTEQVVFAVFALWFGYQTLKLLLLCNSKEWDKISLLWNAEIWNKLEKIKCSFVECSKMCLSVSSKCLFGCTQQKHCICSTYITRKLCPSSSSTWERQWMVKNTTTKNVNWLFEVVDEDSRILWKRCGDDWQKWVALACQIASLPHYEDDVMILWNKLESMFYHYNL